MNVFANVTEEDLINLRKLAEQQKKQRALLIKIRILKQTHDIKLAESLSPITKKLDTIDESTEKTGDVIRKSDSEKFINALPNSSKFSNSMRGMLGSLISSHNSLKKPKMADILIFQVFPFKYWELIQ